MKTNLVSISKIFTEKLFRIPDYQRGYAWKEKQLKDFWNDIIQLEKDKNHYFGVLTLEKVLEEQYKLWDDDLWIIESKSFDPYYVVDGQQRLTTTIILVQSIIERIIDVGILNYTTSDEIIKKFIYESKDKGISKSYIFGYEIDNPSHEFLKKNIFKDNSDNSDLIQETIYTHNLESAKKFFLEKLKNLSHPEIEILYKKITQHLLFNIYSMSEDIDVYITFETMNNRGKPLSHLELLKNRLIYLSTKFNADNHDKRKLRNAINECWKVIYHQLGKNKEKPLDDDLFLHTHFSLYFSDFLRKEYYLSDYQYYSFHKIYQNSYKDYLLEEKFINKNIETHDITIDDIYKYVSSLKTSVEICYNLLNPEESQFNKNEKLFLKRIEKLDLLSVAPLLMIFFQKANEQLNENSRYDLLVVIERYLFVSTFLNNYNYRTIFLNLSKDLQNTNMKLDKVISKIQHETDNVLKEYNFNELSKRYRENGYYQSKIINYFLYEYEMSLKEKSKTNRDKIQWETYFIKDSYYYDNKSIEHIYPQRPKKECWDSFNKYDTKERKILRHVIGNLVPLSTPKNASLGNKCFKEKIGDKTSSVGYKYGSYSEIELTNYDDWTAEEILRRSIKLILMLSKRWKITFGKIKDIVKFLNLEFVLEKEKLSIDEENKQIIKK